MPQIIAKPSVASTSRIKSVDRAFNQYWKYSSRKKPHNQKRALENWEKVQRVSSNPITFRLYHLSPLMSQNHPVPHQLLKETSQYLKTPYSKP